MPGEGPLPSIPVTFCVSGPMIDTQAVLGPGRGGKGSEQDHEKHRLRHHWQLERSKRALRHPPLV